MAEDCRSILTLLGCTVHFCQGDRDHQRTVIAFSGEMELVLASSLTLAEVILPEVDLHSHLGVHPYSGALDVFPFVALDPSLEPELILQTRKWAEAFSEIHRIPVHLYEKAAYRGQEKRLPALRGQIPSTKVGFDFGTRSHENWGTTIVGVRDFLVACNINLATTDLQVGRRIARYIRELRESGDARFTGVRALAFDLPSTEMTQLSFNLTQPDLVSFDEIHEFILGLGAPVCGTELIGVIRQSDLAKARCLEYTSGQVVDN